MLKRRIFFCYLLANLCAKSTDATVSCFVSTATPERYEESSEQDVTGCTLEVPVLFDHGIAKFGKRLKLGVIRSRVEGVYCGFTEKGIDVRTGTLKDEVFMNRDAGYRVVCNCYTHGCNGMYESFEEFATSIESFLECKAIKKLLSDMSNEVVRGPEETQMKEFFERHGIPWPRQDPDRSFLFAVVLIAGILILLAAVLLLVVLVQNGRFLQAARKASQREVATAKEKESSATKTKPRSPVRSASRTPPRSRSRSPSPPRPPSPPPYTFIPKKVWVKRPRWFKRRPRMYKHRPRHRRMRGRGSDKPDLTWTENELIAAVVASSTTDGSTSLAVTEARKESDEAD